MAGTTVSRYDVKEHMVLQEISTSKLPVVRTAPGVALTTKRPTIYLSLKPMRCVAHGMRQQCIGPMHENLIGVNQCQTPLCACFPKEIVLLPSGAINDKTFLPKKEMLPIEKETINDEEFVDILNSASATKSQVVLEQPSKLYKVGDVIRVKIHLIDGIGRRRLIGGDDIRVWMKSTNGNYKASGDVIDLKNGSYIATFKALWNGDSIIHTAIPYTREAIASMLKWRRQYKTLFYYYGIFLKGKLQEYVLCSMYSTIPGYTSVCNLTDVNDNYPWFCGRPLNPLLTCDDFKLANDFDYTQIPVTTAEFITFNRNNTKTVLQSVKVHVDSGWLEEPRVNCSSLPVRDTWNTKMPTGYFQHDEWKQLKCKNHIKKDSILSCIENTTLIIYGDSTTRQWYKAMLNLTNCNQSTEEWTKPKWYEYSVCKSKNINFTLIWAPHVFPFPNGHKQANGKMSLKSAVTSLNELPSTGKVIFVLHYFCHFVRQHYTLYINHVRSLKTAVRNALKRNKDIKVAIKSPHVFYHTMCPSCLNDFQGKIFIDVLQREFEEFKDSVIFLNFWDMNTAIANGPIHPVYKVVWENLRLLFGYVCR
ncbi:hypothetical protein LOTGIDRAFT_155642 [Lottia gigantea]|uniref:NXPE C-terminal domain-containing protein n=1 Tax=Lottia gigantea TaxID=225164 RepID=V3ZEU7_LOTGI|nr:hypothetical protein LOTGIDRAFT_155642 [Lottia gigantea]ESO82627.1 hypothetical protein LOTGIDRAFT_155642 [Lottia gigantea]